MKLFALVYCFLMLASAPAFAQETYTPPPMFDAPAMNAQPNEVLQAPVTSDPAVSPKPAFRPRYSPSKPSAQTGIDTTKPETQYKTPEVVTPASKDAFINNPLLPPIITKGDPAHEKPKAPSKPKKVKAPVPVAKPAIKTPEKKEPVAPIIKKPAPAAIEKPAAPAIEKPAAPSVKKTQKTMPAARVTSEGVVKGPKTMPSVPTTDVAAEKTFEETAPAEQTLMERHQSRQKPIKVAPVVVAPVTIKPEEDAPSTAPLPQSLSLPYERGKIALENPQVAPLIQALSADPSSRLMIQSYASPTDAGENSDRRIALARALDLRKVLMAQGVPSHRVDIRALGQKTDQTPVDRVDLSLYNGQKSAN